jgi:hypothetical protein
MSTLPITRDRILRIRTLSSPTALYLRPAGPVEIIGETMQEQTRQALCNLQTILEPLGSTFLACSSPSRRPRLPESASGHSRPSRPVPPTIRCPHSSESNLVLVLTRNGAKGQIRKSPPHSITLSARARTASGIVRPRAAAVLRFTASSNVTGSSTGRSLGLVPLRILST